MHTRNNFKRIISGIRRVCCAFYSYSLLFCWKSCFCCCFIRIRTSKLWQIVHAKCVLSVWCILLRRKHKSSGKFGEKLIIDWFKTCYVVMNEKNNNKKQNTKREKKKTKNNRNDVRKPIARTNNQKSKYRKSS